jgi:CRP-like cAMP-binding protein
MDLPKDVDAFGGSTVRGYELTRNHLLSALPVATQTLWLPKLQCVELQDNQLLQESYRKISHVYFPTTAIVSVLLSLENGGSSEVAVIGHEGVAGVAPFMGVDSSSDRVVVQRAGQAFRLDVVTVRNEFEQGGPTLRLVLRYAAALMAQTAQTAACTRHHTLDKRLSTWLLRCLDRSLNHRLQVTQELIASLLGVRRAGVCESISRLEKDGIIRHHRGRIDVIHRGRLELRACECYCIVEAEYTRLLPRPAIAPDLIGGHTRQALDTSE